jgi:hypothetical protein
VRAVRAETRAHHYDEVILATGRQGGTRMARGLHLDPVHQLQRRWGNGWSSSPPTRARNRSNREQKEQHAARGNLTTRDIAVQLVP